MIEINRDPSSRQLRHFGWIFFPAFWLLAGAVLRFRFDLPTVGVGLWIGGAALNLIGLIWRPALRAVFVGLIYLTFPIGWLLSNLLLGIVYYLVVTPIGLGLRLLGRDPLARRIEREGPTYWRRHRGSRGPRSYLRQY